MIYLLTKEREKEFLSFCCDEPFFCKILSLFYCYGSSYKEIRFWIQTNDNGKTTAAVSQFGWAAVVAAENCADFEEIDRFLIALGIQKISCRREYGRYFFRQKEFTGKIMKLKKLIRSEQNLFVASPRLKDLIALAFGQEKKNWNQETYQQIYVDFSHRIRHRYARTAGIYREKELVSCAMSIFETEKTAILGAVATKEPFQNKGYATAVVTHLLRALEQENKTIYLFRDENKNQHFYQKIGFDDCGEWSELS